MSINKIKNSIIETLKKQLNLESFNFDLEIPPDSKMGDFALPCYFFSKKMKKSPAEIAKDFSSSLVAPAKAGVQTNFKRKIDSRLRGNDGEENGNDKGGNRNDEESLISQVKAAGPYLNIFLNREKIIRNFLNGKLAGSAPSKAVFGEAVKDEGKILIEYLSANPNKPLHLGQARNICIGDSLVRVAQYLGFQTDALNLENDAGANVGYNIVGHLYYGYPLEPAEKNLKFDHYCGKIYTEMRQREDESEFKEKLSQTILSIEKKDNPQISKIHQEYTRKCALAQFETCWKINSFFDLIHWETDILHLNFFGETLEKLKSSGFVKYCDKGEAKGCWILDLSQEEGFKDTKNPYQILIKSDNNITYVAKDIVYAIWKLGFLEKDFFYQKFAKQPNNKWIYTTSSEEKNSERVDFKNYSRAIAVIDNRQSYAQSIVKKALEILGYLKEGKEYHHLAYGVVYLTPETLLGLGFQLTDEEKKEPRLPFSSRKGWFVTIDQTFDLLKEKIKKESLKRNSDIDEEDVSKISEKIASGVLRFDLLKTDIKSDITFDLNRSLDLKGDTGMYVLYTYARICSIFEKAKKSDDKLFSKRHSRESGNLLPAENFQIPARVYPASYCGAGMTEEAGVIKMDYSFLSENIEWEIVKELLKSEEIIKEVFDNLTPNILCNYMIRLCQLFNTYYSQFSIIKSEEEIKRARLNLLAKLRETLKIIMNLIGMEELSNV